MKKIIIDAMGGDKAPAEIVKGTFLASSEYEAEFILVGNREKIEEAAAENEIPLDHFEIIDTDVEITMEDDPMSVVKKKADSSMGIGLRLLADGKGDAFVSCGNTGALFTGASLVVRKVKGVRRAAIAALLPMDPPVLLLDSGANINVTPDYLEQFALMGSAYMKKIHGVECPRVGLLNNGSEDCKGTELQIETYKLLRDDPDINFVGNVEGNKVMANTCDVLVTDGFTGNILLKTMEGMGKLMLKTIKNVFYTDLKTKMAAVLVKPHLGKVKKNFDSTELGGAPLLGISKPVIKAHGSSNAKAFKNAIRQAIAYSEAELAEEITQSLAMLSERKKAKANVEDKSEN